MKAWLSLKLLIRATSAFRLSSNGDDARALRFLRDTEKMLGPLTQYRFGIEPALLEIFSRGCVEGLNAQDYDWDSLKRSIVCASEYNSAEKLHLLLYLEELATTAGVSLSMTELADRGTPKETVNRRLIRRFPKLSEA